MLRNIFAAIVGYVAMAAAHFALFSLLWLTAGPSRAFEPGSWEVSGGWVLVQVVLGLVGAYIGGQVCAWVAHDAKGAAILIGLVIVLGVVNALISAEMAAGPRPDDVTMMEATAGARQPVWYLWLNPLIGAVGVWFGTRRLRAAREGPHRTLKTLISYDARTERSTLNEGQDDAGLEASADQVASPTLPTELEARQAVSRATPGPVARQQRRPPAAGDARVV